MPLVPEASSSTVRFLDCLLVWRCGALLISDQPSQEPVFDTAPVPVSTVSWQWAMGHSGFSNDMNKFDTVLIQLPRLGKSDS